MRKKESDSQLKAFLAWCLGYLYAILFWFRINVIMEQLAHLRRFDGNHKVVEHIRYARWVFIIADAIFGAVALAVLIIVTSGLSFWVYVSALLAIHVGVGSWLRHSIANHVRDPL